MPNIYDMADTWNNAATVFTAIKINVTDTASNANSLLMDLQVGGTSRCSVTKAGAATFADSINFSSNTARIANASSNRIFLYDNTSLRLIVSPSALTVMQIDGSRSIGWVAPGFATAADVLLARDAANTLAQRNGVNQQAFNIYNTYTDASNYERFAITWQSNIVRIGTERAGTGVSRQLDIAGNNVFIYDDATAVAAFYSVGLRVYVPLTPLAAASTDLGQLTIPWRDIFLRPSSSLTPNANGDLCIEATDNTTLTFKYKGSDGTVRSGTVTLS